MIVHGGDIEARGRRAELLKFRKQIRADWLFKERGMLGEDCDNITILNRRVCQTTSGYTWEADPAHAQVVCRDLGLDPQSKGGPRLGPNNPWTSRPSWSPTKPRGSGPSPCEPHT